MADCEIKSYNAVRAKIFGKKLTSTQWLILHWSKLHTHTEFKFSKRHNHISHSATLMDGNKGSRFKYIKYSHPWRWDTVIVPMTDNQEDLAYEKAVSLARTLYDTFGQLSHISGLKIWKPSEDRTWCTKDVGEIVYAGRQDFYYWLRELLDTTELRPDQMDMMARCYFDDE